MVADVGRIRSVGIRAAALNDDIETCLRPHGDGRCDTALGDQIAVVLQHVEVIVGDHAFHFLA